MTYPPCQIFYMWKDEEVPAVRAGGGRSCSGADPRVLQRSCSECQTASSESGVATNLRFLGREVVSRLECRTSLPIYYFSPQPSQLHKQNAYSSRNRFQIFSLIRLRTDHLKQYHYCHRSSMVSQRLTPCQRNDHGSSVHNFGGVHRLVELALAMGVFLLFATTAYGLHSLQRM